MAGGDAETIQAVRDGHLDRYAELVDQYQGMALRLAFSLLGNYEDAKDASQEAFVSAYRSLGRFRGSASFATWLYRIVVNKCKDAWKHRNREPLVFPSQDGAPAQDGERDGALFADVEDTASDPSDCLVARELSERISRAILGLPMRQRTVFLLHHVHGCSLKEAADVMRCRLGTVKSHLFRATERLRVVLHPCRTQEGR